MLSQIMSSRSWPVREDDKHLLFNSSAPGKFEWNFRYSETPHEQPPHEQPPLLWGHIFPGGVLTIFWVTGRLGPFDPPFSTYVEFWPLLLGSDVEYWPPFFQALYNFDPYFSACRILTPIFRLVEFWPLYFLELKIFDPLFLQTYHTDVEYWPPFLALGGVIVEFWPPFSVSATDVEFWGHRVRPSLPARDELEYPPRAYFQAPLYFSYISFKCQPLMNSHPTNLVRGQWFWFQPPLTSSHSAAARSGQPWNSWLIWLWAHRHTC